MNNKSFVLHMIIPSSKDVQVYSIVYMEKSRIDAFKARAEVCNRTFKFAVQLDVPPKHLLGQIETKSPLSTDLWNHPNVQIQMKPLSSKHDISWPVGLRENISV